jgi:replicative DNA helicase
MEELEAEYCEYVKQSESVGLDLSRWLPSLHGKIRPLVPGELAVFIADTGVGKTALLQNLAFKSGITSLLFELELPGMLTFERFLAIASSLECKHIEDGYRVEGPGKINFSKLRHVWVCDKSGLSIADMKKLIQASALKIGKSPSLVLVDYVQLVRGEGKTRYERTSSVAEDLKVMAKELNVIVVAASQIGRKQDGGLEIGLHDAKNAGEIENSSGLVIGAWREPENPATMHLRILKNTKGGSGTEILCNFRAATMQITEQSPIDEDDVPKMPYRD